MDQDEFPHQEESCQADAKVDISAEEDQKGWG